MECDNGVKDEFQAIESRRGWQPLFMEIREKSPNYSIAESKKLANRDLNRYRDVNPFDHSRIILSRGSCNYINASLVKVQTIERSYILTQGPLPSTVSHFWTMAWEQNCRAIVMLNNTIEKNQIKCHTYWPTGVDNDSMLVLDDVKLTVRLVEEVSKKNYILRTIKITDMEDAASRVVQQYHYTTWPDFGVPATPSDFIHFLQEIRETGGLGPGTLEEPIGPAVVHCSAGIGRSGTFCIVDTALLQLERGERINVKELLLEMRRYRMGLIQTAEQLRFSYQSIIEGADALGIDLRRTTQYEDQSNEVQSSEESDYSDDDESISEEDSEQDIDLTPPERPPRIISNQNSPRSEDAVANDVDEPPPPIPPRAESLSSPENYDRPLPLRPKRPRVDVDGSTTSETEEEVVEPVGEAPNNEIERKRRKQMDEASPRVAESENGSVRQRRQERKEKTQQLIDTIKEKQKELERNADTHSRSGSKWVGIGVGIFILVCVGFRYFQG